MPRLLILRTNFFLGFAKYWITSFAVELKKQKAAAKARAKLVEKEMGRHMPKLLMVEPVNVAAHLEPDKTMAEGSAPQQTLNTFPWSPFVLFFFLCANQFVAGLCRVPVES